MKLPLKKYLIKKYNVQHELIKMSYVNETTIKKAWKEYKKLNPAETKGFQVEEIMTFEQREFDVKKKKFFPIKKEKMLLTKMVGLIMMVYWIYEQ